ncbi:hypothetical protein BKA56DRAFT_578011 [Ilyonectria sp. MPI-CAGE-AT-0026]|nr:hypothetical protein BKA56DRAFT_578011 [Ilyonectria sp. MPI-CAGE-AT-0026]
MSLASFAVPLPEARVRDILLLCALASVRLLHPTPITQPAIVLIHVGCSLDRPCFPLMSSSSRIGFSAAALLVSPLIPKALVRPSRTLHHEPQSSPLTCRGGPAVP